MVYGYRYIQLDEDGRVKASCDTAIEGVTIDTEGMEIPAEPTDAIYDLYYGEEKGLYWKKIMDFDEIPPTAAEEQAAQVAYLVMKMKGM
jgi:hypothetical protein